MPIEFGTTVNDDKVIFADGVRVDNEQGILFVRNQKGNIVGGVPVGVALYWKDTTTK